MQKTRERILIVDDEILFLDVVRQFLELEGLEVVCAENTTEALEEIIKQPIDAVLLDLYIQGEYGMSFLVDLKKNHPTIPVIIITGAGYEDEMMKDALTYGASGYVGKMAGLHNILIALKNALRTKAQSKPLFSTS